MLRSAGKHDSVVMCAHRKNMTTVSWGGCKTVQREGPAGGKMFPGQEGSVGDGELSWRSWSQKQTYRGIKSCGCRGDWVCLKCA